jgi:hypothetical protein
VALNFEEIAIAFKSCNSDARFSFKEHLKRLNKQKIDYEHGFTITEANNYILTDIEKLLSKAILNICATDYLIKRGYFSWGFVTSYYANFFLIQGLNRTQLSFITFVDRAINCLYQSYQQKTIYIKAIDKSINQHQREFECFFDNFKEFKNHVKIDRYWNIGTSHFELGSEPEIRNNINYGISDDAFYELDLDIREFNKIIKSNSNSPFDKPREDSEKVNYARKNLKLAISRLRMLTYILNIIAIRNSEYESYYKRNMKNRLISIQGKYTDLSEWINKHFHDWLIFDSELVEKDEVS